MKGITETINFTKKDVFNANNAISLKDVTGQILHVTGVAFGCDIMQETGEEKDIAVIKTSEGMFSTISATAIRAFHDLADMIADEIPADAENWGGIAITAVKRESGKGREFVMIELA